MLIYWHLERSRSIVQKHSTTASLSLSAMLKQFCSSPLCWNFQLHFSTILCLYPWQWIASVPPHCCDIINYSRSVPGDEMFLSLPIVLKLSTTASLHLSMALMCFRYSPLCWNYQLQSLFLCPRCWNVCVDLHGALIVNYSLSGSIHGAAEKIQLQPLCLHPWHWKGFCHSPLCWNYQLKPLCLRPWCRSNQLQYLCLYPWCWNSVRHIQMQHLSRRLSAGLKQSKPAPVPNEDWWILTFDSDCNPACWHK